MPTEEYLLSEMLSYYPWFTTARILRDAQRDDKDSLLEHYLLSHPLPLPMLYNITLDEFDFELEIDDNDMKRSRVASSDVIEKFLDGKEKRVQPKDDTPEEDVSEKSNVFELTDELATEELARIYMQQGLVEKADEIYTKLGDKPTGKEQ